MAGVFFWTTWRFLLIVQHCPLVLFTPGELRGGIKHGVEGVWFVTHLYAGAICWNKE